MRDDHRPLLDEAANLRAHQAATPRRHLHVQQPAAEEGAQANDDNVNDDDDDYETLTQDVARLQLKVDELSAKLTSLLHRSTAIEVSAVDDVPGTSVEPVIKAAVDLPILPNEVWGNVFSFFDLKERVNATLVCQRWYNLLTRRHCPLDDVGVVNLFEEEVWLNDMKDSNRSGRITSTRLRHMDDLLAAMTHIGTVSTVKLWYRTRQFVEQAMDVVLRSGIKTKCVDVYPYNPVIPLSVISEHMPYLDCLVVRPHGSEYFRDGMNLPILVKNMHEEQVSDSDIADIDPGGEFSNIRTLVLDNINLTPDTLLPMTMTSFDYSHRASAPVLHVLRNLRCCKELDYLSLSHIDFRDALILAEFVETLVQLPALKFMVLRFCHFPATNFSIDWKISNDNNVDCPKPLPLLKVLKLDLCYGNLVTTVHNFLEFCSDELRMLCIHQISDEFDLMEVHALVPTMRARQISFQVALLQKTDSRALQMIAAAANGHEPSPAQVPPSIPSAPESMRWVLSKIDFSFVEDKDVVDSFIACCSEETPMIQLMELKFVQCPCLSERFLEIVSRCCQRLKKLTALRCKNVEWRHLNPFISNFEKRQAKHLCIVWKEDESMKGLAAWYLGLLRHYRTNYPRGLNSRFYTKTLPGEPCGQRAIFWQTREPYRTMVVQDYSDQELTRIYGFATPVNQNR